MFENVKVGDSLYDVCFGWGRVKAINCLDYSDKAHLIEVEFSHMKKFHYSKKGKNLDLGCENQTLFWDEIKFDMPFSLENELKKLKRKRYVFNENNVHFVWNNKFDTLEFFTNSICETFNMVYFEQNEDFINFIKKVKENKITREQFFSAYKKVFGGRND